MILEIAQHAHPALRTKGRKVAKVDAGIRALAADMIETMHDAEGIGLAAQQVAVPIQLFVLDVPQMKDRPSTMRIGGKSVAFETLMPLVLVNPEIQTSGEILPESEGCLSFPGIRSDVPRPLSVKVEALTLEGEPLAFEADGFLARAVQHEFDHLQGVLFIDRLSSEERADLPKEIQRLVRSFPTP